MEIQVIIPTYNGRERLPRLLSSLETQDHSDFEVTVAIDGSTDDSEQYLQQLKTPLKLTVISQENRGRAAIRNFGAKSTPKDSILLFVDDDMRLEPNVLRRHVQHHRKHPNSVLVGAQMEDLKLMKTDFQRYKAFLSRKWMAEVETDELGREQSPFITAAHCSIPKSVFDKVGAFDERLSDTEDYDLAVRCFEKEVPIFFSPDIVGWHDDFITPRGYVARLRQYRLSHERLIALKPGLATSTAPISGFKKVVYGLFAQRFWFVVMTKTTWLQLLPIKGRYRVYDWIVTGFSKYFPKRSL